MRATTLQYIGNNKFNDRIENDFYATPLNAIEALLNYEKFEGNIWECACGDGIISKELIKAGYNVYSSDLVDRGYGDVLDFLKEAGLANDTHYPESQNGFHHMKLTFKKGKVIPKLYFSLGYAKRKDPEPRIFQSGRPVDVLRESNLTNSSRVSGFGYAPTQGS